MFCSIIANIVVTCMMWWYIVVVVFNIVCAIMISKTSLCEKVCVISFDAITCSGKYIFVIVFVYGKLSMRIVHAYPLSLLWSEIRCLHFLAFIAMIFNYSYIIIDVLIGD